MDNIFPINPIQYDFFTAYNAKTNIFTLCVIDVKNDKIILDIELSEKEWKRLYTHVHALTSMHKEAREKYQESLIDLPKANEVQETTSISYCYSDATSHLSEEDILQIEKDSEEEFKDN